jgi:hypothetical protein
MYSNEFITGHGCRPEKAGVSSNPLREEMELNVHFHATEKSEAIA